MKIDGRLIAREIKDGLKKEVVFLKSKNIIAQLTIILIGNDPNSLTYIRQKIKAGKEIGVKISNFKFQFAESDQKDKLLNLVQKLNKDESVHGIIIQRPVPLDIEKDELDRLVIPGKDVDGFHPESPLTPPVTLAVLKILEFIFQYQKSQTHAIACICDRKKSPENFYKWLRNKKILIIGRGETAGKPVANIFQKMNIPFTTAHSQTKNMKKLGVNADIIISCVGKSNIVRPYMVSKKSIVIGVGLHREDNMLKADYDQEEIARNTAFYTPVPGGVGPVNVACLFENLLKAASLYKNQAGQNKSYFL